MTDFNQIPQLPEVPIGAAQPMSPLQRRLAAGALALPAAAAFGYGALTAEASADPNGTLVSENVVCSSATNLGNLIVSINNRTNTTHDYAVSINPGNFAANLTIASGESQSARDRGLTDGDYQVSVKGGDANGTDTVTVDCNPNDTPTPTVTPSETVTPTPTETPTPTVSPSETVTPTPTETPTPTPTVTPSETVTPTPTPTETDTPTATPSTPTTPLSSTGNSHPTPGGSVVGIGGGESSSIGTAKGATHRGGGSNNGGQRKGHLLFASTGYTGDVKAAVTIGDRIENGIEDAGYVALLAGAIAVAAGVVRRQLKFSNSTTTGKHAA